MAREQGARTQMAFAFEGSYGVPPGSGYARLPYASKTLSGAQPLIENELLGYGRDPLAPVKDAVTVDGDVVVPICARSIGYWLKLAFGDPTTTPVAAQGSIQFAVNPSPGDTITLNGTVWTFVASGASGPETEIQGTLIQTLDELVDDLNASADVEVVKATYSRPTGTERLVIVFDTAGLSGNAFTIAASAAVPSGATLIGGGFSHEFASGSWTLPSASIEFGMPSVPQFSMYSGVRLDRLSFTMQRGGLLQATAALIAQGEANAVAAQTGSLAPVPLQRLGHWNGSIRRDGVALGNVVTAEVSYSNRLDRIETIRNDGQIDGADPSMAMMQGRIDVRFADTTLLQQAIDGTPAALTFGWSLGAVSLQFEAHAVYLPVPRRDISGPQGVQASFDWQAALATSPARMCTATLVNDVASY